MKLISAPMATLTHCAFRILVEKFSGCDEYYNEMINAPSLVHGGQWEKFYIDAAPVPEKIVWQLTGKDVSSMVKAAEKLKTLPGIGIDLNMGCSAPDIVRSGAGVAWLLRPLSEAEELVREVGSVVRGGLGGCRRFSVKCRLGGEDFTDDGFFSFTDMLVRNGVQRIALHPRTQKDRYREKPRYEYAEALAGRYASDAVEIVVNGDVFDEESFEKVLSACPGCMGVMIGRAAAQKPWIFARLKGVLPKKDFFADEIAYGFIDDVEKYQPPEFWKTRLNRFFFYYTANFSFAHYFQSKMLNSATPDEARRNVAEYFSKVPSDRLLNLEK